MSTIENIVKSLAYATEHNQGLHLTHEEVPALNACIAQLKEKLAKEHQLSDALYLLLVDDPNTKLKAEQILIDIYGKCEPSPSDVSVTQDVTTPEPPEDALHDRIAELEAENAALKAKLNAGETVDEWGKPDWVGKDVRK